MRLLAALILAIVSCSHSGLCPATEVPDQDDMRLLRTPDIHGETIVFCYAGNLWTVSAGGDEARRLTSHIGYESNPKFSPNGQWIAFEGDYDGNRDIFVIPAVGGEPRRLTFHPANDRMIDWQPDGQSVRFQSTRTAHRGSDRRLWTVPLSGGLPTPLILPTGGLSSYSPDGKRIAYNRKTREHRTWKRYKGGWAQDIWIYDFEQNNTQRVTDWVGSDNFPMWHGDTIYYTSDQTGRLEIWSYDTNSGEREQVTRHREYDVKYPSLGPDAIVYENGGWLYVLDLNTLETRKVTVSLHDDRIHTRPAHKPVAKLIDAGDIAPDAKRAVFGARGDIFTVPAEKGNVRNLTGTPGIRERDPVWSPNGKWIAYFSDRTGEYEIYLRQGNGKGEEKSVTKQIKHYPMGMQWSPDSQKLLFHDAALNLFWLDVNGGKVKKIDQSESDEISDYAWSADSRWIAYAKAEVNAFRSLFLYDLESAEVTRVTTDFSDEAEPTFDPGGKYLFFVSSRHFNPTIAGYDLVPLWTNQDGIYLVTLQADEPNPLAPESDEVEVVEETDDDEDTSTPQEREEHGEDSGQVEGKAGADTATQGEEEIKTEIDLEGIDERIVDLGLEPGNYYDLVASEGKVFFLSRPLRPGGGRGNQGSTSALKVFVLEDREGKDVLDNIEGYALSADGKKILYASNGTFGIVDAVPDQKPADKPLRVDEMVAKVDPRAEWAQIFRDAWRLERDFFYDPGMHGTDWDQMYERYSQLVPYVAHRADLDYLLGELIGELNCSHSYVRGSGDNPELEQVSTGLLGCDFDLDNQTNRYRITNILTERDWNSDQRTPLHGPGIEIAEGDFLLAVDGIEVVAPANPYMLFEGKVDRQVVLKVGKDANGKDSREVTVEPIDSDSGLRYEAWVQTNRRKVDEMSGGRIGYIHVPNTAVAGQQSFAKGYYPQLRREGLIIDERFNGGGFVPDFFTTILSQKLVNLWKPRYGQNLRTPGTAFLGHMAMLVNGYAGSGGDLFPYYFKFYELGPVIGTRTWGGLVGVSRRLPLIDGGVVTFPEFAFFNLEGAWEVENHGVEPNIDIDNLPHEVIAGRDPQLEKAVELLLQQIEVQPVEVPDHGRFPRDKTR